MQCYEDTRIDDTDHNSKYSPEIFDNAQLDSPEAPPDNPPQSECNNAPPLIEEEMKVSENLETKVEALDTDVELQETDKSLSTNVNDDKMSTRVDISVTIGETEIPKVESVVEEKKVAEEVVA